MRSDDPVPPMPMASHLVDVILNGIRQRLDQHYQNEGGQFLLWAMLHPLPDGSQPATLGAVSERLKDREGLRREIQAIREETGAPHHRLGLRVQFSSRNYELFDVVVGMAAAAVDDYIALPPVRTYTVIIQLDPDQQQALQHALSHDHRSEQQFLSDCLRSGIAHAQERMRDKRESLATEKDDRWAETIDDDIPF